jgi:hypothetical protein
VLLDVPVLKAGGIDLEVRVLRAHVAVLAELADFVSLSVGVDARLEEVKLVLEDVEAQALLKVRLEHVRAYTQERVIVGRRQYASGLCRGTLHSDTGEDGRRYVYLDLEADEAPTGESSTLISELRAHNATLREQLEVERQAHAVARRIIAGLVEKMSAT